MTDLPDFSPFGYIVDSCLNNNIQGGRLTYKAIDIASRKSVVIKQFRFATTSDWSSYKAIEREIEVLKDLNHKGIPKYITKFDPCDGLCLVQEYKDAEPLSKKSSFNPEEIKLIAKQILEILTYLQARTPIIIHRDLKPENILVDNNINVYLVDFGLARVGNNTMALSSLMGGTLGFMPPEQLHNQRLTEASDLYGLGVTLICLITQTKSIDIGTLVDFSTNRICFKDKAQKFSFRFIEWLEKLVEPNPAQRFLNAQTALDTLQPLDLFRTPNISLSIETPGLDFTAKQLGENLCRSIVLKNTVPETILQGRWSVNSHKSDPPHTPNSHPWIHIKPQQFQVEYQEQLVTTICIDTKKLRSDKFYKREIILESNSKESTIQFDVKVKTASIELPLQKLPYMSMTILALMLIVISGYLSIIWGLFGWIIALTIGATIIAISISEVLGAIPSALVIAPFISHAIVSRNMEYRTAMDLPPPSLGLNIFLVIGTFLLGLMIGLLVGLILTGIIKMVVKGIIKQNLIAYRSYDEVAAFAYIALNTMASILFGIAITSEFNPLLWSLWAIFSFSFALLIIHGILRLNQIKNLYLRQESQSLIDP